MSPTYRQLARDEPAGSGGANASLFFGISSLVGLAVVFVAPYVILTAPVGVVVGALATKAAPPTQRPKAIIGLVCSAFATLLVIVGLVALWQIYSGWDWGD